MHAPLPRDTARLRPPGSPEGRPNLSRAARRDIRRAAALANEVNMHSFTIHRDGSITWTPWRQSSPAIKDPIARNHAKNPGKTASTDAPSKRTLRARARAAQHAALTQRGQPIGP